MKWKRASSSYDTHQCKNHTIQRMALKGTSLYWPLKNVGVKLQKQKFLCKKLSSPLIARKRPLFTGLK
jgi:hypothetical protein